MSTKYEYLTVDEIAKQYKLGKTLLSYATKSKHCMIPFPKPVPLKGKGHFKFYRKVDIEKWIEQEKPHEKSSYFYAFGKFEDHATYPLQSLNEIEKKFIFGTRPEEFGKKQLQHVFPIKRKRVSVEERDIDREYAWRKIDLFRSYSGTSHINLKGYNDASY